MPTYEYMYKRKDGTEVIVERSNVPISERNTPIEVEDGGEVYTAERILSLTADMSYSWTDDVRNSDLPPVDAKPEDVQKVIGRG